MTHALLPLRDRVVYVLRDMCSPLAAFVISFLLLIAAALLVRAHAVAIGTMRTETLPLAADISPLQDRLAILEKQVEVSKLAAAVRPNSAEERLHVFVFPTDASLDRPVAVLNTAIDALRGEGNLRGTPSIIPGEAEPAASSGAGMRLVRRPLTLIATVNEQGMHSLLRLVDLSGLLTIQDALTPEQSQRLFALTEGENPAGIAALGQFLSTDLLSFLREPQVAEEHLLSSFSSDAFAASIRSIMQGSFFQDATALAKGAVGQALQREQLWPLPFLELSKTELKDAGNGWQTVCLSLWVYGREG